MTTNSRLDPTSFMSCGCRSVRSPGFKPGGPTVATDEEPNYANEWRTNDRAMGIGQSLRPVSLSASPMRLRVRA